MGAALALARRALVCLDLTNLDENCDPQAVDDLCRRAQTPYGSVAAVCVWPRFVAQACAALAHTGIKVATVVGFPTGDEPVADVIVETQRALADGADEIDMVAPWRALRDGNPDAVSEAVRAVKASCGDATLKAILETGELADPVLIALAARHALEGGADFLKTSTGKAKVNATLEAAEILLEAISQTGSGAGLKVAGGVRTLSEAGAYIDLADRLLGAGRAGPKHFRIGASGLLDSLLAALEGSESADGEDDY
jgi:deoxyribose-phosphate aldolase